MNYSKLYGLTGCFGSQLSREILSRKNKKCNFEKKIIINNYCKTSCLRQREIKLEDFSPFNHFLSKCIRNKILRFLSRRF